MCYWINNVREVTCYGKHSIEGFTMSILYTPATLGQIVLQNHMVMAPMTRSRATGNNPNALMADYYAQRSTAGLIITEGTSSSPNGLGYPRIPGIFSKTQIEGWKSITEVVHGGEPGYFCRSCIVGELLIP